MMHYAPIPVESTGDHCGNVVLRQDDPRHSRASGANSPTSLTRRTSPASLPRVRGELDPPNTAVAVELAGDDSRDAVLGKVNVH